MIDEGQRKISAASDGANIGASGENSGEVKDSATTAAGHQHNVALRVHQQAVVLSSPDDRLLTDAHAFLDLLCREEILDATTYLSRRGEIGRSIARTGHYTMQFGELEHACRVAWRGSARCIGRLPWQTLTVRDCRNHETPEEIFQACVDHLRLAPPTAAVSAR